MESGKHSEIITRFPPEPNGYLHIGHAKALCLDFGAAADFGGKCNLRMDDTNPDKEDVEYVDAIQEDIKWLGFDWNGFYYASDYYPKMFEAAIELIEKGLAFVCDLSPEEIHDYRGTLTEPGKESPFRNRGVEENKKLFLAMKNGEFEEGQKVLRAKIDMSSPNINMRDPVIYRIVQTAHHRTGGQWCIYPMYDFAHPIEDAMENITHSLCSLEFEDHRPLYNWVVENVTLPAKPRQIEFARLNLTYTVMSKRKLRKLVEEHFVGGWDDPRMPTLCGMRRRGYPAEAVRDFTDRIGLAKRDSIVDFALLEHCVRENLNKTSLRLMGVLEPIKVVIENYPENQTEYLEAVNNPEDETAGVRKVAFSREIYIEREDFMEDAPKKFYRLTLNSEVRLRYAYFIKCTSVIKNEKGEIVELRAVYDPATKGGDAPDGRKVKSTIHWVNVATAKNAVINLYDRLFVKENPEDVEYGQDFTVNLNPDSLKVITDAKVEAATEELSKNKVFQFERKGYFVRDISAKDGELLFNRTATLKDAWARIVNNETEKK
ncbi:MAG: glutamine--tRNA ligase/YqeY domain fusion protein [Chitinivibrionia bacterium]|nr:glutamine--tRNA ligase/YqeY domain fusion protein [Chitinivibrionia bacterium]